MAKPEHLDKIGESVEVWNAWRDDNPGILPALWAADLVKGSSPLLTFLTDKGS